MRDLVKLFKALSDPNRLRILKMLEVRPMAVCEITSNLGLAPSTVSKHLYLLREAGLVLDERDGKWVNYRLARDPGGRRVRELLALVSAMLEGEELVQRDRERTRRMDRQEVCRQQNLESATVGILKGE